MSKTSTHLLDIQDAQATPRVVESLRAGDLAAMPTETVYGLFADATDSGAIAKVYAAKGRPQFNPLISHCASIEMAAAHGAISPILHTCVQTFWPGPLTIVVPRSASSPISDLACAGLDTVALRCPEAPFLQRVIEALGVPLAGPSANRSGRISPTDASAVLSDLDGVVPIIIDGGRTPRGIESTVITEMPSGVSVLRPGAITAEQIEAVTGQPVVAGQHDGGTSPQSPGLLTRHYSPATPMRLDAVDVRPAEALLAFGYVPVDMAASAFKGLNLSEKGDLVEAASNLYGHMRALDLAGAAAIAVMPVPHSGLGVAINDRLQRAAARG